MHTIYNLNINLHKAALSEAENLDAQGNPFIPKTNAVSNFMVKTMAN